MRKTQWQVSVHAAGISVSILEGITEYLAFYLIID